MSAPMPRTPAPRRGRALIGLLLLPPVLWALVRGFDFLRDGDAPKWLLAAVAVIWGVGAVGLFLFGASRLLATLPDALRPRVEPYVFVGPALLGVAYFLALPTLRTLRASLFDRDGDTFVGLANFVDVFTEPFMLIAFRNNVLWLVFGAGLTVLLGLLIAVLADRSRHESLIKSIVFMPMAISLVGAGVIWKFIYSVRDEGAPQIGLLNAIVAALGGEPQAWIAEFQPWNNLFLIVILIWLQTGFAMVLFSAAIKGVPTDVVEAAVLDGATPAQIFFRITLPLIRTTVLAVAATVTIFTLKIFDIVLVMTGGNFGTDVIATQFYTQYFVNRNFGLGSAIAIVLLVLVMPVVVYNLRQVRAREGDQA